MSYSTGTINSLTPAVALMTTLDTAIDGHVAWVFVEEVISGTSVCRVYRSIGTANGFGTDFYIYVFRSSDTSTVSIAMSETWDAGTKRAGKIAPYNLTAANTPAADQSYPTVRNPLTEMAVVTATAGFMHSPTLNTNTTGFEYWISVTAKAVTVAVKVAGTPHGPIYAGLYDSFHPTSLDAFPLVIWGTVGSATAGGGASTVSDGTTALIGARTRAAGWVSGAITYAWAEGPAVSSWTLIVPIAVASGTSKEPLSGKWWFPRVVVRSTGSVAPRQGIVSGLLPSHILWANLTEVAGEAIGDTITVDGTLHTCIMLFGVNSIWVSQAA